MRRVILLVTLIGGLALSASASADSSWRALPNATHLSGSGASTVFHTNYRTLYWGATTAFVANQLVSGWTTSKGDSIVSAGCWGVWSGYVFRRHHRWYFNQLGCNVRDDVSRKYQLDIVITGRYTMRANEVYCNDHDSQYYC